MAFQRTASMASARSYSSSVPSRLSVKMSYELISYERRTIRSFHSNPHSKFAPAQLLCVAQKLSKGSQKDAETNEKTGIESRWREHRAQCVPTLPEVAAIKRRVA
jgi:hypothetical protein